MRQTIQKADSASKNCMFQECIYFVLVLPIDNFDPNDKIGLNKANSQRILFRLFIEYWKPFHQSVGSTDNSFELPMIRPVLIKYQIYKYILNVNEYILYWPVCRLHGQLLLPSLWSDQCWWWRLRWELGSFFTFCQLNLPNSGKYIAANPNNSVVELNDFFFCLRQLNEGLRHCWRPSMRLPLQISWNYVREPTNITLVKQIYLCKKLTDLIIS